MPNNAKDILEEDNQNEITLEDDNDQSQFLTMEENVTEIDYSIYDHNVDMTEQSTDSLTPLTTNVSVPN